MRRTGPWPGPGGRRTGDSGSFPDSRAVEGFSHGFDEGRAVERLLDDGRDAEALGVGNGNVHEPRAQEDERLFARVLVEALDQEEAVSAGHPDVGEDRVESLFAQDLQGLAAV